MRYVTEKDKVELDGYFKEIKNFELTKALMSHIRRKLQVIHYFKTGKLVFDYDKCLNNTDLSDNEKEKLMFLYKTYEKGGRLSKKQIDGYFDFAKQFTERI